MNGGAGCERSQSHEQLARPHATEPDESKTARDRDGARACRTLPLVNATAAATTRACPTSSPATSASYRNANRTPTNASAASAYQTICSGRYARAAGDCTIHGSGTIHICHDGTREKPEGLSKLQLEISFTSG